MALGENHTVRSEEIVDDTLFIPELWSQEVIAAYKKHLVMQSFLEGSA